MDQASLELWKKRMDDRKSSGLNVRDCVRKIILPNMPITTGKNVLNSLNKMNMIQIIHEYL